MTIRIFGRKTTLSEFVSKTFTGEFSKDFLRFTSSESFCSFEYLRSKVRKFHGGGKREQVT